METAKTFDEFVEGVASILCGGSMVAYDLESLTYAEYDNGSFIAYGMYIDTPDDELKNEVDDWEMSIVEELRDVLKLPGQINPPYYKTFPDRTVEVELMKKFALGASAVPVFVSAVEKALKSETPYMSLYKVLETCGLRPEWEKCYELYCRDYVRQEIKAPRCD